MNRVPTLCLALMPLLAAAARADEPPTTRPVNEVTVIRIGNGGNFFVTQPGAPLGDYGGTELPIAGAPLPAGHQDATPVATFLHALQVHIPHFRYIIRGERAGDAGRGAMLPAMDTSDLTLGEWVNYVNANCPGIDIQPDTSVSEKDPLYVVTLSTPTPATVPHVVRAVSVRAAVQVQQRVRSEDAKAALADVLSLVQVMVDESPYGRAVKLKVHEPTGMLVFDGPAPLADAVAAAVETMSRLTPEQLRLLSVDLRKLETAESEAASARGELADAKAETERMRKLNNSNADSAEREIADLKRQLAAYQSGPPKK
jgi:hypothetical protein